MSIPYDVEPRLDLVLARADGALTCEAFCAHLATVARDESIPPDSSELLDVSGAAGFVCDVPDLYRIAASLREHARRLRRLAVVSKDRSVLERLLLLQELSKGATLEVGVFDARTSAAAWLNVRGDELDAVSA